jgi:hypothetical protein
MEFESPHVVSYGFKLPNFGKRRGAHSSREPREQVAAVQNLLHQINRQVVVLV